MIDTSDIPEVGEDWFKRARLVTNEHQQLLRELRIKGAELEALRAQLPGKLQALHAELNAKCDEVDNLMARISALPPK